MIHLWDSARQRSNLVSFISTLCCWADADTGHVMSTAPEQPGHCHVCVLTHCPCWSSRSASALQMQVRQEHDFLSHCYSSGLPILWKHRPFLQLYILNNCAWWWGRVQSATSDHGRSNEFWLFWGANSPMLPSVFFSWGVWNAWAVCQSQLFHCFCVRVLELQWIIHRLYSQTSTLINYDFGSASTASTLMAQSMMVFWGRKSSIWDPNHFIDNVLGYRPGVIIWWNMDQTQTQNHISPAVKKIL